MQRILFCASVLFAQWSLGESQYVTLSYATVRGKTLTTQNGNVGLVFLGVPYAQVKFAFWYVCNHNKNVE